MCAFLDGVEDVLEAWLLLVERLVNANSLLNTPHKIGVDCEEATKFDVRKYLMKCHRVRRAPLIVCIFINHRFSSF